MDQSNNLIFFKYKLIHFSIISLEKLVDHLQSPLIKAKIYIVNFHDFKNDFEILTPKVEQVLKGEYSYGKLVHLIKNCGEGVEKRSQVNLNENNKNNRKFVKKKITKALCGSV